MGNTAILRSTGVAASQSAISSQEAKDFKVVIALDNPPDEIRRTFLHREDNHSHPSERPYYSDPGVDRPAEGRPGGETRHWRHRAAAATKPDPAAEKARKEELQGVFVVERR